MDSEEREDLLERLRELQDRLDEAEETLRALRQGEVDAIVVSGPDEDRIYTLAGADEAYRILVQEMAEGAVTIAPDGLILFANEQFASMVKSPLETVIGSEMRRFIAPHDEELFSALLESSLLGPAKRELELKAADGPCVPAYLSANRIDISGLNSICLTITDLTEQKRNEQIVAAGKLARSILEQAAEAIIVIDPEGKIIHASPAAHRLAGGNALLHRFDEIYQLRSGKVGELLNRILTAARHEQIIEGEECLIAAGSRVLSVIISAAPVFGADGALLGCVVTMTDITERKRYEATLVESEAHERSRAAELQAIMEAVPAAIFITHDPECRHIICNRMGYERLGLPYGSNVSLAAPESERPTNFRFLRDGKELPPDQLPMRTAARTGKVIHEAEFDIAFADGTTRHWLGGAMPLPGPDGKPRGAVGAFIDITERKQFEQRLREAEKIESVGMLAGGVAHDFNNLLVGIIGNASLAQEILPYGSQVGELLERVIKSGEQAAHLTRQLLAYAGKGQFVIEPVDVSEAIYEIADVVRSSIPKRITLDTELQRNLPPIEADRSQIQQVFMNLAINASEAIGSKQGLVTVKTGVQETVEGPQDCTVCNLEDNGVQPGKYVYLDVSDNGAGMDEEIKTKIFDPFFTTKFTGRGLGLAGVAGIVRSHKGAVKVSSTPGQGSRFTVFFPASDAAAAVTAQAAGTSKILQAAGAVLVIDDEEIVRDLATRTLKHYGFGALAADSGRAAIEILKKDPAAFSLVLLDSSMPGLSGPETLFELLKVQPDVRVMVSSGYDEAETLKSFRGFPVCGFIHKPYTSAQLAEKVKQVLALPDKDPATDSVAPTEGA